MYKTGGMRYLGDYYIMIMPSRATQPFKVLCNIYDGAGKYQAFYIQTMIIVFTTENINLKECTKDTAKPQI